MPAAPNPIPLPRLLAVLADPTRLRLLNLLAGREVCVCYFVEVLQESQPKVSRHLASLRRCGLVRSRRQGKWIHYSLQPLPDASPARPVLDATLQALQSDPRMQADLARLARITCKPQQFVTLKGAPQPTCC